jgi:geranylgeranyl pyrophosphate synthase
MRASHSGQAMDIHGQDYLIPQALVNDKVAQSLGERVLATHRLKSAAPASYLAKIGALLGDGTPEQIHELGAYYEALGIAFQIIDDTLNLKGFKDNLKSVRDRRYTPRGVVRSTDQREYRIARPRLQGGGTP